MIRINENINGVIDIYAALRPITSSRMQESILVGNNIETASVHNLNKSNFSNGLIFGDAISSSFKGKKSYFYDALYGAFEYSFDNHLVSRKPKRISNLENFLNENKFKSFSTPIDNSEKKLNYSYVVDENNYLFYAIKNNTYVSIEINRLNGNLSATTGHTNDDSKYLFQNFYSCKKAEQMF